MPRRRGLMRRMSLIVMAIAIIACAVSLIIVTTPHDPVFTSSPSGIPQTRRSDCQPVTVSTRHEGYVQGSSVSIGAVWSNCAATPIVVDNGDCGEGVHRLARVSSNHSGWRLVAGEEPQPALAPNGCTMSTHPVSLSSGESYRETFSWNGHLSAQDGSSPLADPGEYVLVASIGSEYANRRVWILPPPNVSVTRPLLLVREKVWTNATDGSSVALPGDFGPHCAPAEYSLDPPSLGIRLFQGSAFPETFVVRDYRGGRSPQAFWGSDGVELHGFDDRVLLLGSPFGDSTTLRIERGTSSEATSFTVDDVILRPGESATFRRPSIVSHEGSSVEVVEILEVFHLGDVPLLDIRVGRCD